MSDLNIALVLKFVNQATAPARAAMKDLDAMGRKMEDMGRDGLAWSNRNLEASENRRRALRGETMELLAMGASIYAATEPAVRFEEQMAQVAKVINFEGPNGFKHLRDDIFELNTSGGLAMAASDIMAIQEAAGQSNLIDKFLPDDEKRRQLIAFTKDAGIMGVAFDLQAGTAGKAMTLWRNQLKLGQDDALLLGDAVNHLSNNMDAEAAAIVNVISRSGALAKTRGLNTNEIAALSAAFVLAAPSPEIAATAMKKFTGTLTAGAAATDQQSAAMKNLGFDTVEMAKRMHGDATGSIMDVMLALSKLPIEEQGAALKQLFGEESIGAIAPLLANTDLLARAFGLVADETEYAGSMTEEFKGITETTAYQRRLLNNQLHRMSVIVGAELLPIMNDFMATMMPVISQITDWIAANPELVKTIGMVVAGLFAMKASSLVLRWTFEALTLGFIRFDRILSWGVLGLGKFMRGFALLGRLKPLKWARLIPKFAWRAIITPIKWLALAGALSWKALIRPLIWAAKFAGRALIGPIGWALLAGELLWNLLIKPMGWDKYIPDVDWAYWFSFEWLDVLPNWDWSAIIPNFDLGNKLFFGGAAPSGSSSDPAEVQRAIQRGQSLGYSATQPHPTQGARALGGPARAGFLYEINERGQEFFSPDRDGHVIPAGKVKAGLARAANSLRIGDINITAAPGMSPMDIARAVRREIERLADNAGSALHDGGAYAD